MISATLARRFFQGQNPIGHKIVVPTPGKADVEVTRDIVGVAGDISYLTRHEEDSTEIYLPYLQAGWPVVYVMVRTDGDPKFLAGAARAALGESGFEQPIAESPQHGGTDCGAERQDTTQLGSGCHFLWGRAGSRGSRDLWSNFDILRRSDRKKSACAWLVGASARGIVGWIMGQALLLAGAGDAGGSRWTFSLFLECWAA